MQKTWVFILTFALLFVGFVGFGIARNMPMMLTATVGMVAWATTVLIRFRREFGVV